MSVKQKAKERAGTSFPKEVHRINPSGGVWMSPQAAKIAIAAIAGLIALAFFLGVILPRT